VKPDGHSKVAEEAGIWRFKIALESPQMPQNTYPSGLDAFYLGNWLADLSQVKDPHGILEAATKRGNTTIKKVVSENVLKLKPLIEESLGSFIIDYINELPKVSKEKKELWTSETLRYLKIEIKELFDLVEEEIVNKLDLFITSKKINEFIKHLIHFKAYVKFVRPENGKSREKIQYDIFNKIFNIYFTQYYPHEHLDRPDSKLTLKEHSISTHTGIHYADKVDDERENVYKYIVDAIKVIIGQLHELDKEWAKPLFSGKERIDFSSEEWQLGLSKFGHILHLIEDFFAHSNFIEIAVLNINANEISEMFLNNALQNKATSRNQLSDEEIKKIEWITDNVLKFKKRLEKYHAQETPFPNGQDIEDNIVTGYFDVQEAFLAIFDSILNLIVPKSDNDKTAVDKIFSEFMDTMFEITIKLINEFKPLVTVGSSIKMVTIFRNALHDVKENIINSHLHTISTHSTIKKDIGKIITSLFSAMDSCGVVFVRFIRLIKNVLSRLSDFDSTFGVITKSIETLLQSYSFLINATFGVYRISKTLNFSASSLIEVESISKILFTRINSNRIGSHSLLSKDMPDSPLYKEMFNCAKTVHWHIVDAMVRWSDEKWIKSTPKQEWIDWEKLIFHFLGHPGFLIKGNKVLNKEVVETALHLTDGTETLESIYLNNVTDKTYFSFDTFLFYNNIPISYLADLPGGVRIDYALLKAYLKFVGMAEEDLDSNLILKPSLRILIPNRTEIKVVLPSESVWYDGILKLNSVEWKNYFNIYIKDRKNYYDNQSTLNNLYTYEYIDTKEMKNKIINYNKLRLNLEKIYNQK